MDAERGGRAICAICRICMICMGEVRISNSEFQIRNAEVSARFQKAGSNRAILQVRPCLGTSGRVCGEKVWGHGTDSGGGLQALDGPGEGQEDAAAIGGTEQFLTGTLRVGHHSQHITVLITDAGNIGTRAVGV